MPDTRSELKNWRKINSCSVGEKEILAVLQPYAFHDIPDPVIDQPIIRSPGDNANIKLSEEEMMVSFLDEMNKKIVSDGIRQRKWDEKLVKVKPIFPETGKQVSVNKKALCKKEQREKFIQKASENSSTKCSNIMGELSSNSLDKLLDTENFTDCAVQEAIHSLYVTVNLEKLLFRDELPADTSDALLWKRIEQVKKL
uniref:Uncharacterized protein n=1 Tax=Rhizophagus irregularis (strain DAOM 181602 / DAOM 197198 / MUCL 43194) TaxID=747089 RepID=U9T749_RHIID